MEKTDYIVLNEHTLGYKYTLEGLNYCRVLHSSVLKGSPYLGSKLIAPILITENDIIRKATDKDFEEFRVIKPK